LSSYLRSGLPRDLLTISLRITILKAFPILVTCFLCHNILDLITLNAKN
jgi:hypothetical protein